MPIRRAPPAVVASALLIGLALADAARADDDDYPSWRPVNAPAVAITGPLILLPGRLRVAGVDIPLRLEDKVDDFRPTQDGIPARIYAVTDGANPALIDGKTLCGGTAPTWIVVVPAPPTGLEIDAFTSAEKPAKGDSPGLCGTFTYQR